MSTATQQEVLTLEEAASFLRLPVGTVQCHAARGEIPGRQVEGDWRFLRAALESWLGTPDLGTVLLSQAGALAEDESLENLLEQIYAARGRTEVEPSDG